MGVGGFRLKTKFLNGFSTVPVTKDNLKTKAERREQKKARRKFQIHSRRLKEIYRNAIFKRLKKDREPNNVTKS